MLCNGNIVNGTKNKAYEVFGNLHRFLSNEFKSVERKSGIPNSLAVHSSSFDGRPLFLQLIKLKIQKIHTNVSKSGAIDEEYGSDSRIYMYLPKIIIFV